MFLRPFPLIPEPPEAKCQATLPKALFGTEDGPPAPEQVNSGLWAHSSAPGHSPVGRAGCDRWLVSAGQCWRAPEPPLFSLCLLCLPLSTQALIPTSPNTFLPRDLHVKARWPGNAARNSPLRTHVLGCAPQLEFTPSPTSASHLLVASVADPSKGHLLGTHHPS